VPAPGACRKESIAPKSASGKSQRQGCSGHGQRPGRAWQDPPGEAPRRRVADGCGFRTLPHGNPTAFPAQRGCSDTARASGVQSLRVCLRWESSAARYAGSAPRCGCNICQRGNSSASLTVPLPPVTLTKPTKARLCQHSCTGSKWGYDFHCFPPPSPLCV